MGKISDRALSHWSIAEANRLIKRDFDQEFWLFILKQTHYPEIYFDTQEEKIVCPGFIPFADLATEVINDLDMGTVRRCQTCEKVFDINKEEGIFGNPANLDHFICQTCAEAMSAKTFFDKHLVT